MSDTPSLDIVCLCADWCGTCRAYGEVFEALKQSRPDHVYRWIDIEDEADALGEIDIETFPTLMLAHSGHVLFAGPVLPRLPDVQRLVDVQADLARQQVWPSWTSLGLNPEQGAAFAALAKSLQHR